jgi:flavin-dependent dehydrogenase
VEEKQYDALIVGGGPGGTAAATYLAQAGKKVLVLEKEHFPRFHIGESLLPYNQAIFREMGVLSELEAAGYPKKLGAQFHLSNGSKILKLVFRNGCWTKEISSFQVERSTFDHILLKRAAAAGAEVREGWTVTKTTNDSERVSVSARSDKGETATFTGKFLLDASGRGNFTGNQEGIRIIHKDLKKLAVFAHFENVRLDEGTAAGDTVIVRLEDKWFWVIPISKEKTSVGCVMDQEEFMRSKQTPEEAFTRAWESSSVMARRMELARRLGNYQTTTDFSYYNRTLVGPRLLRVGDAAGFMDPIFSAGVYLAMYSGKIGAETVLKCLARNTSGAGLLANYERKVFHGMKFYWDMVEHFYTRPFMELFIQPRSRYRLPDAIVAMLAGELEGGWKIAWRRWLFFQLVKLQAKWPLVPRITYSENVTEHVEAAL